MAVVSTTSGVTDASTPRGLNGLAIAAALWLLAFSPILFAYFAQLWPQDHLSHFPITLLLIGVLVHQAAQEPPALRVRPRSYGIFLAVCAVLLWLAACYLRSGLAGMVAALIGIWAIVDLSGGRTTRAAFRPAFVFSFALLTLPFGLDRTLIIGLQKLASRVASAWLDLQGIANMTTGVVVRTPQQDFLVEEACSGVNSLFAAMTIALFWVIYSRLGIVRSVLFLAAVLFWVLLVNAFRVWVIVFAQLRWAIDLTAEPNHTLLGLATFAAVILLAASTDWAFRFLLPPKYCVATTSTDIVTEPAGSPPPSRRRLLIGSGLAAAVCLMTLVSFYRPAPAQAAAGTIPDASLMPAMPSDVLPAQIGSWELKDARRIERDPSNAFGLVSQVWTYHNGSFPLVISLDGPYESWHDLGYCYGAIDWQLRDSQNVDLATMAGQTPMKCVELNLYRGAGQRSLVMFTSVDRTGAVVRPPTAHGSVLRNLTNRLRLTDASVTVDGEPVKPPVFQVQLFAETDVEMTPEERASVDHLYDYTRRLIVSQLQGGQ